MPGVNRGRGWNVFDGPGGPPERNADHFVASPFTRLARVHATQVGGDALIALALANSLFFSIPTGEARTQVALYLALTMAPFAVVAPFIGPAIDRAANGRRLMVVLISVSRVLVGLWMIATFDDLWVFFAALLMLVLGKGYNIAKSAIVPSTVADDQELVEANAKLSIITGIGGFVVGIPGVILGWIGGPTWIVGFATFVFGVSAVLALSLPKAAVTPEAPAEVEEAELRSRGIVLASSAMAVMRAIVGFLLFLMAFALRESPAWQLGLAVACSVAGSFLGSILAPWVRRTTQEEDILVGAMAIAVAAALLGALTGGLVASVFVTFAVGFCANTAKLAFDSIVQRDAPDANRGRSFARFETRFQIFWVIGAFIPVLIPIPAQLGFLIIALAAGFAGVTYWFGRRDAAEGRPARPRGRPLDRFLQRPRPPAVTPPPEGPAPGPDRRSRGNRRRGDTGATRPPPGASRRRRPTQRSPRRPT